jgi:hypothetical protein
VAMHLYGRSIAQDNSVPDVFERYVAMHPYDRSIAQDAAVPDAFERYLAIHPHRVTRNGQAFRCVLTPGNLGSQTTMTFESPVR